MRPTRFSAAIEACSLKRSLNPGRCNRSSFEVPVRLGALVVAFNRMQPIKYSARIFLASCLILNSPMSLAKFSNETERQFPGTAALLEQVPLEPLAPAYKEIAKRKMFEQLNAPARIKELLRTRVKAFFPRLQKDQPLPQNEVENLIAGAKELSDYMKSNDASGQYDLFAKDNLEPYLRNLKAEDVVPSTVLPGQGKKISIGNWTLESVVVTRMLNYIGKAKNFPKLAMSLATGIGLKGATRIAGAIAVATGAHYVFPQGAYLVDMFLLMTFWDSFKAGPLGTILNSGSGWFVRPTSELMTVLESRYTSVAEVRLNRFYDGLNPKAKVGDATVVGDGDRNDRVRLTTMDKDGMDFAGMSPEDQLENWEQGLNFFVTVAKRFSQLLRGTYHGGRDLMMLSWTDQQNITQLVEIMDSKRVMLRGESNEVLAIFKTAFLVNREFKKKEDLENTFEEFENLCDRLWQEPDMTDSVLRDVSGQIKNKMNELANQGLSWDHDIKRLLAIQKEKARGIQTAATSLAIGELRSFYGAERNRNLARGAQDIEQAIRNGLGTSRYVEESLPLVQRQLRAMKQKITGRTTPVIPQTNCDRVLTTN